jgi:hypothetical protein
MFPDMAAVTSGKVGVGGTIMIDAVVVFVGGSGKYTVVLECVEPENGDEVAAAAPPAAVPPQPSQNPYP